MPSSDRGYSGYGFPNRAYFAGTSRLPKFLGNPHVHMPCSTTAVDLKTRPFFGLSGFAFRTWNDVGFHNSLFEAQSHGLRTPCLRFAATVTRWLAQNSVPTAGQLCRTGLFTCWVPLQSFSLFHFPLVQVSWRTPRRVPIVDKLFIIQRQNRPKGATHG